MKKSAITRNQILKNAFELIYIKGYQATSIDDILATLAVTKGAFFHHFQNKEEMGLALIQEYMQDTMQQSMMAPLKDSEQPLEDIYELMRFLLLESPMLQVQLGCPTHNLIQEMAPINPRFKAALHHIMEQVRTEFINILEQGKQKGHIKAEINSEQVALFIMVGYAGVRNIGKVYNDHTQYEQYLALLKSYLNALKS
jgi:TetR/AcrR family transcriptional regulator, transcriptional repressor for nem operon